MKIISSQVFKILPPIALKTPYFFPHVVCKTFSQYAPKASSNNKTDLYNATFYDYCKVALQSTVYHNFLKRVGGGTRPILLVLRLQSAIRSGDPRKIAQAVEELYADARLNSKVPRLEGESIFGSAKR